MKKLTLFIIFLMINTYAFSERQDLKTTPVQEKSPRQTYPFDFHTSYFRVAALAGIASFQGQITEEEDKIYSENKHEVTIIPGGDVDHFRYYFGCEADIMFCSFHFFKPGLKARFNTSFSRQKELVGKGELLKYMSLEAGLTTNIIIISIEPINIFFNNYFIVGPVFNGKLKSAAALRNAGWSPDADIYKTGIKGYTMTFGSGPHFSLDTWCPVTLGFNFIYTYSKYKFKNNIALYNEKKSVSSDSFGIEIAAGFHF